VFTDLLNQKNNPIQVQKVFKIGKFVLVVFCLSVSCSPKLSNKLLPFFFDGVTVKDSLKTKSAAEEKKTNSDSSLPVLMSQAVYKDYVVHYPYKEKECNSCHDENSKSELLTTQPGLCYKCHDDFSKTYKFVHGPVAGGYCTSCHNPHMAKEKKLLLRTGQQLCLYCHDSKDVLKNENHKDIADTECTMCHNPHGGENKFMLN
jgi:predicted CXXCH cytochrome family protein